MRQCQIVLNKFKIGAMQCACMAPILKRVLHLSSTRWRVRLASINLCEYDSFKIIFFGTFDFLKFNWNVRYFARISSTIVVESKISANQLTNQQILSFNLWMATQQQADDRSQNCLGFCSNGSYRLGWSWFTSWKNEKMLRSLDGKLARGSTFVTFALFSYSW